MSTRVRTRPPLAPGLAVVALAVCAIGAIVCLGLDTTTAAFVDHLGSRRPRAGGTETAPVLGLASVCCAVAIRATMSSRSALSRLVLERATDVESGPSYSPGLLPTCSGCAVSSPDAFHSVSKGDGREGEGSYSRPRSAHPLRVMRPTDLAAHHRRISR
jgi:hypothetical protein